MFSIYLIRNHEHIANITYSPSIIYSLGPETNLGIPTLTRSDATEKRPEAAERVLAALPPPDSTYFTDGSTEEGFGVGGGGISRNEQSRGNARWSVPAGRWTSSYPAEQVAFLAAVNDDVEAPEAVRSVRI